MKDRTFPSSNISIYTAAAGIGATAIVGLLKKCIARCVLRVAVTFASLRQCVVLMRNAMSQR